MVPHIDKRALNAVEPKRRRTTHVDTEGLIALLEAAAGEEFEALDIVAKVESYLLRASQGETWDVA